MLGDQSAAICCQLRIDVESTFVRGGLVRAKP
jgi:hypothetical protein